MLQHAQQVMLIQLYMQRRARQAVTLPVSPQHCCPTWPPFTV